MCLAAAAPDSGAGSCEAMANVLCTRHWAHIARIIAGAIASMYAGSK